MARIPEYDPQLAQLVKDAPSGPGWLHELKYDGYRIDCRIDHGSVTLLSRNGKRDALDSIGSSKCRTL